MSQQEPMSFVAPVGEEEPNDEKDRRAQEVCAHLLIFTYLQKSECKDLLLDDDLRARVNRRLMGTGMELVDNFYSEFFAIRMRPEIESDVSFDWSTNLRLQRGAVALIVILWAKLVLPRRVAQQTGENPDENNLDLFPENKPRTLPVIRVQRDALFAEFGGKFGKANFQRYLGQLRNLGFVAEDRSGHISEGPLLDLLIDGAQMAVKLRDSVLWDLLGDGDNDDAQGDLELQASEQAGGDDIGYPDGIGPDQVRDALENTGESSSLDTGDDEEEGAPDDSEEASESDDDSSSNADEEQEAADVDEPADAGEEKEAVEADEPADVGEEQEAADADEPADAGEEQEAVDTDESVDAKEEDPADADDDGDKPADADEDTVE